MIKEVILYKNKAGQLFESREEAEWNDLMEEYCDKVMNRGVFKSEQEGLFKSTAKKLVWESDLLEKYVFKLIALKKKIDEQNTTT